MSVSGCRLLFPRLKGLWITLNEFEIVEENRSRESPLSLVILLIVSVILLPIDDADMYVEHEVFASRFALANDVK